MDVTICEWTNARTCYQQDINQLQTCVLELGVNCYNFIAFKEGDKTISLIEACLSNPVILQFTFLVIFIFFMK